MSHIKSATYGTWTSPVTADWVIQSGVGVGSPTVAPSGQFAQDTLFWLESRPNEGGRTTIVQLGQNGIEMDCVANPYNVRSRVHEYGGGSYTVHDRRIYFVNFQDQQIYQVTADGEKWSHPARLTDCENVRFADLVVVGPDILCVMEAHSKGASEPENSIVAVNIATGDVRTVTSGHDFYSFPRANADGTKLAFTAWDHPNMPWNGTTLYVGMWKSGALHDVVAAAGAGDGTQESIFQPSFGPDGQLYYVSDRSNWWNIYRYARDEEDVLLTPVSAEFGEPQWAFGQSTYAFIDEDHMIVKFIQNGLGHLAILHLQTGAQERIDAPFTMYSHVASDGQQVAFVAASPKQPMMIAKLSLDDKTVSCVKSSKSVALPDAYISQPEVISFHTAGDAVAHGFYYPPTNPDFTAPAAEKPPLLVMTHGGPTAATFAMFNPDILYWTTRGFGVLDVNYRGSTGYGRNYREALREQWGVADLDDCCYGAMHLVRMGRADENRLSIMGGSAGGYTTLAALTFRDTFKAGASYFGISDITLLAKETHKFESRYMDQLIGPYPEEAARYEARSPIHFVEQMDRPVIFFQGSDDLVVPPNQAERMVEALKQKGVPVAYLLYEGEGHGFRKAENIKRSLEAQLYFFGQVFGFTPADDIDAVDIMNG